MKMNEGEIKRMELDPSVRRERRERKKKNWKMKKIWLGERRVKER